MLATDEINQTVLVLRLDPLTGFDRIFDRATVLAGIDATKGTDYIDRIQTLLLQIAQNQRAITTGQTTGAANIIEVSVPDEMAVKYGAGGTVAAVQQAVADAIAQLRALFFPETARSPLFRTQTVTHQVEL